VNATSLISLYYNNTFTTVFLVQSVCVNFNGIKRNEITQILMMTNNSETIEQIKQHLQEHPEDFTKWEQYVTAREQEQQVDNIIEAYESFLQEFPLLYGYWKKYADLQQRINPQNVVNIYERGVKAIPQSVDLWTHYCTYVAENSQDLDEIRR
jgi:hypothetical protein